MTNQLPSNCTKVIMIHLFACMIKVYAIQLLLMLSLSFTDFPKLSYFSWDLGKSNIWPVHKKMTKKISINTDCSQNINLVLVRTNDSCTNQLLSIVHDIYMAFNADPTLEVQGVFLDTSKAFDKVWLEGLICKLVCLCLKSINKHVFLVKH